MEGNSTGSAPSSVSNSMSRDAWVRERVTRTLLPQSGLLVEPPDFVSQARDFADDHDDRSADSGLLAALDYVRQFTGDGALAAPGAPLDQGDWGFG